MIIVPAIQRIQFSFQIKSANVARRERILTSVKRAYKIALSNFAFLMKQWAIENVPADTRTLISDFISTCMSSPAVGAFVVGNPNTSYASYVNEMRGVMWTRWGVNPAKDAYFDRALAFAYRIIPLALHRAIRAEGIDITTNRTAAALAQQFFQLVR